MSSILLTPPAAEPLALDEARAFLRLDTHDDDEIVVALIAAARLHIETQTRRALITQGWRLTLDAWPADGRIAVRPGPLRDLTAARVTDLAGNATALDPQHFVPDLGACELVVAPWAVMQPTRLAAGSSPPPTSPGWSTSPRGAGVAPSPARRAGSTRSGPCATTSRP